MRLEALSSPLRWLSDAVEFRRLPNAHRAWSRATGKLRPESDAEYLVRLRGLARERFATAPWFIGSLVHWFGRRA